MCAMGEAWKRDFGFIPEYYVISYPSEWAMREIAQSFTHSKIGKIF